MYSEAELEAAVAAGAISAQSAASLRDFVARQRATPAADEEQFRLLTGFNDIFVAIALVLLLVALAALAGRVGSSLAAAAAVAAASWGLAEFFTRRRRMALPSILLLVSFAGAAAVLGMAAGGLAAGRGGPDLARVMGAALAAVLAAAAHWRRFHVPVTVAVGAAAAVACVVAVLAQAGLGAHWALLLLAGGLAVFALAMWWDMSDRARSTRRSDVAFWLHLAAAPMIVHPVFALLGLLSGEAEAGLARAAAAVAVYVALALVALVVDRRALLVSALFYVLYAISALLRAAGAVEVSVALTGLVVGSALLALSAFWRPARAAALGAMPEAVRARVPAG